MVSAELLGRSELRARQVKKCDTQPWGGLSLIATGDFAQKTPVKETSLAFIPTPPADAGTEQSLSWEDANLEALQGRRVWAALESCVILDYSHRCQGVLSTLLKEMLVPGGQLSERSWMVRSGE